MEVATWSWPEHCRDSRRQSEPESRAYIVTSIRCLDLLMILARCGPFQSVAIPNIFKSVWRHMEAAYGILGLIVISPLQEELLFPKNLAGSSQNS